MIINRKQFQRLSENEVTPKIVIPVQGNSVSDAVSAINNPQTQRQLNSAESSAGDVTISLQGSNYQDNGPTQLVNKAANDSYDTALTNQVNPDLFAKNPSVEVNDTVDEGKRYTKKQLEEARLANIREHGEVRTKKNLFEGWDDEILDVDELINYCSGEDFLYIVNFGGRYQLSCANSPQIQDEIISDIENGTVEETHEMDGFIDSNPNISDKFDHDSTVVVRVSAPGQDDYYILWEQY